MAYGIGGWRVWVLALTASVALGSTAGCNGEDDEATSDGGQGNDGAQGDDGATDPLDSDDPLHDASVAYAEAYCDCYWSEDAFTDRESCVTSRSGIGTDSCEAEALFEDDAAAPRLRCLLEAAAEETACIAACGDKEVLQEQCQDAETAARDNCDPYPESVTAALNACVEPEPFWMVGDDGVIFGIDHSGMARREPQPVSADLLAIVCDGAARAWIAGEDGIVLRTLDGGRHWTGAKLETNATLRAVAQAQGEVVAVVGDDGAMFTSEDAGTTWTQLESPARSWTGVAGVEGAGWIMTADDGAIWSYSPSGGFELRAELGAPLWAVDVGPGGHNAAAVGEGGILLESSDAGRTWTSLPTPTSRDLYAVDYVGSPGGIVAAGEDGVVVTIGAHGPALQVPVPGQTLLGLHVTRDGHGAAVGEGGTLITTANGAQSWHAHDLGLDVPLYGLDQPFHAH